MLVLLKVEFFNFRSKSEEVIQNEVNNFIKNKNVIDIKMTCTVDVNRGGDPKHVQILVMYDHI